MDACAFSMLARQHKYLCIINHFYIFKKIIVWNLYLAKQTLYIMSYSFVFFYLFLFYFYFFLFYGNEKLEGAICFYCGVICLICRLHKLKKK